MPNTHAARCVFCYVSVLKMALTLFLSKQSLPASIRWSGSRDHARTMALRLQSKARSSEPTSGSRCRCRVMIWFHFEDPYATLAELCRTRIWSRPLATKLLQECAGIVAGIFAGNDYFVGFQSVVFLK